jgi:hypothetical protein
LKLTTESLTRPQRWINSAPERLEKSDKKSGKIVQRKSCSSFSGRQYVLICLVDHIAGGNAMVTRQRIDRLLQIQEIKVNPRNARTHSKAQIAQIAESIKAYGFGAPVWWTKRLP